MGHEAGFRFICAGPERKALRLAVDEAFDRPTAILHLNWAISVHSDNLPGLELLSIQSDMKIVFHGRAATNLPRRKGVDGPDGVISVRPSPSCLVGACTGSDSTTLLCHLMHQTSTKNYQEAKFQRICLCLVGRDRGVPTNGAFILASFLAWFTDPTAPEA
jgi:hypothetical protein